MQKKLILALFLGLVCTTALAIPLPNEEEKKDDDTAVAETEAESDEGSADEDAGSGKKDEVPDAADSIEKVDIESSSSGEGSTDSSENSAVQGSAEPAVSTLKENSRISPSTVKNITNMLSKSNAVKPISSGANIAEATEPSVEEGVASKKGDIEKQEDVDDGDENKESEASENEAVAAAEKKATLPKSGKRSHGTSSKRNGYGDSNEEHHGGHNEHANYHHDHEHEHGEHEHQNMHHHHGHHHGFVHEWGQEEGGEVDRHDNHHEQAHEHEHEHHNDHEDEHREGGYGGGGGEGFHGGMGGGGGGGGGGFDGGFGGGMEGGIEGGMGGALTGGRGGGVGGSYSGHEGVGRGGYSGHEGGNHGGEYGGHEAPYGGYGGGGCDRRCRIAKKQAEKKAKAAKRFFKDASGFVPLQTMAYHCRDMIINTHAGPVVNRRNCVPIGIARRQLSWDSHKFTRSKVPERRASIEFKRHAAEERSGGFNSAPSGYGMATPYGHPVTHPGFTTMGFPGHAVSSTDVKESIPRPRRKRQQPGYEQQRVVQHGVVAADGFAPPQELAIGGSLVQQPANMAEAQDLASRNPGDPPENQLNAIMGGGTLPGEQSNYGIAQQINSGKFPGIPSGIQGVPGVPGIQSLQGFADSPAATPVRPDYMAGQPDSHADVMGMPNGKWQ